MRQRVEPLDECRFYRRSDQAGRDSANADGENHLPDANVELRNDECRNVSAEHVERAVANVDQPHHAERKA
jgi:hypothetical protein